MGMPADYEKYFDRKNGHGKILGQRRTARRRGSGGTDGPAGGQSKVLPRGGGALAFLSATMSAGLMVVPLNR